MRSPAPGPSRHHRNRPGVSPILKTLVFLLLLLPAAAQTPKPPDPLGRDTPRGTVIGFLRAAQRDRPEHASRYLELREAEIDKRGPELVRQLRRLMDAGFITLLDAISGRPDGEFDDGLALDQERAGVISLGDTNLELRLVRSSGVWLISKATLDRVPAVYAEAGFSTAVTPWLARWAFWLGLFPLMLLLSWVMVHIATFRRLPTAHDLWKEGARTPVIALGALVLHWQAVTWLGMPVIYRYYYYRVLSLLAVAGIGWFFWLLTDRFARRKLHQVRADGLAVATSLLVLGRRLVKALIFLFAVFAILGLLGFEMKTAIAGLGIGGIAIALAAQKTLENLFGGLSLLSDRVIHIGDLVKVDGRQGMVEDVGLRSTRIRTKEWSELSIPNGVLATAHLENLSRRSKLLVETPLTVDSNTSAAQLARILDAGRAFLASHPFVEPESLKFRLTDVTDHGHRLELSVYILLGDAVDPAAAREEILLRLIALVEAAGASLARPRV